LQPIAETLGWQPIAPDTPSWQPIAPDTPSWQPIARLGDAPDGLADC
jgi:hypothetical protein